MDVNKMCVVGLAGVAAFVSTMAIASWHTNPVVNLNVAQPTVATVSSSSAFLRPSAGRPSIVTPRSVRSGARIQYAAEYATNQVDGTPLTVESSTSTSLSAHAPIFALLSILGGVVATVMWNTRPWQRDEEYALLPTSGRKTIGPLNAGDDGWRPGQGTSLGNLFGGGSAATKSGSRKETSKEEFYKDIEIKSESGVNYAVLKQLLADKEWEEADNEHRRLLIELCGESAVARGYCWPTEVTKIPNQDMEMLDKLWRNYSGGKFGFTVQRKIWTGVRGDWLKFFIKIDWVFGEDEAYRKWPKQYIYSEEAATGHLPLTNALRGTSLLTSVLEHEAFGGKFMKKSVRK
uniref:GUN4-like domain-containing protein n=1 Tax=Eutreptiella gymnastica TaxID=73025 RepID=A0A7S1JFJ4_9EUGL